MLSIEERCLLLCWAKSMFSKDSAPSQLSTPKISDISSSSPPSLNSIPETEDGSFFLSLLLSIDPARFSLLNNGRVELISNLTSFFHEFHFDSKDVLASIHKSYDEESSKWDVMELVFLLAFLQQRDTCQCGQPVEYFYNFFQASQHLPLTLPIVLKVLLRGVEKLNPIESSENDARFELRRPLTRTSLSKSTRRHSIFFQENEELKQKIRLMQAQLNDLESENSRLKDILYDNETSNSISGSSSPGIYKQLLEATFTIEKQVRELSYKDSEIFNLKSIIDSLKDDLDILKNENILLSSQTSKISAYKSEISKLKVYKKIYHELRESCAMCKEDNLKLLKKIQSLSFQISIYEARKKEYDSLSRELEALLKENFTLAESMKTLEKFSDEQGERIARLTTENRCLKLALESRKEGSERDSGESQEIRNEEEEYFNCEDLEFEGKSIDAQILDFLNLPQDFIDYSKLHCKYVDLKLKYSHKKRARKKEVLELKSKNAELNEKLFEISRDYKLLSGQHAKLNSDYKQTTEKVKSLNEIIAQQSYIIHSKASDITTNKSNLSSRHSLSSEPALDLPKSEIDKEVEELELKLQFIRKHALASRPANSSESVFEMTPIKIPPSDLKQFDSPSTDISLLEDFTRFLDSHGKKASPSTIE